MENLDSGHLLLDRPELQVNIFNPGAQNIVQENPVGHKKTTEK